MSLTVVVTATEFDKASTQEAVARANDYARLESTRVMVWDCGYSGGENRGPYPVFFEAAKTTSADILLFIHNDCDIMEEGYDDRLHYQFDCDPGLGLVGFIGSDQIDFAGGRGTWTGKLIGTASNFQETHKPGSSPAEAHGARISGSMKAAVVDGVAMCFRRELLAQIPELPDFPPHHFYDRLLSCEVLDRGYDVEVMGIACDHRSGTTANRYQGWHDKAKQWCEERGIYREGVGDSWDHQVYLEAQHQFLTEWRERRRFIPLVVTQDGQRYHTHPAGGPVENEDTRRPTP